MGRLDSRRIPTPFAGEGGPTVRVLFVDPPFRTGYRKYVIPNLGLAYLAAALRDAGHEVAALDGSLSQEPYDDFETRVREFAPDAVGFSAPTCKIVQADAMAQLAKRLVPRVKTLVGGTHVSSVPAETMAQFPNFDLGFVGEAEASITPVVESLVGGGDPTAIPGVWWRGNGRVTAHPQRAHPTDLARLPPPAWDLFDLPRMCPMYRNPGKGSFDYPMMTRRGCPYHCLFCKGDDGNTARHRPIDDVVDEIERALGHWGADAIMIFDDAFTLDAERTRRLCQRFLETGLPDRTSWNCATRVNLVTRDLLALMKRAGCRTMQFGAESGDQRILDANRKEITLEQTRDAIGWCRELGLVSDVSFVFGLPIRKPKNGAPHRAVLAASQPRHGDLFHVRPVSRHPGRGPGERRRREPAPVAHSVRSIRKAMFAGERTARFPRLALDRVAPGVLRPLLLAARQIRSTARAVRFETPSQHARECRPRSPATSEPARRGRQTDRVIRLTNRRTAGVLAAMTVAAGGVFFALNWRMYTAGHLVKQDDVLLNLEQYLMAARGMGPLLAEFWGSVFGPGINVSPVFWLFYPLVRLWPAVPVMLLLASLLAAATALPIFGFARRQGGAKFALVAAALFLLTPETASFALSGMWPRSPVFLAAALLLLAYAAQRPWLFAAAAALVLATHQEMVAVVVPFAALAWLDRRGPRWWAPPLLLSLAWIAVIVLTTGHSDTGRGTEYLARLILTRALSPETLWGLLRLVTLASPLLILGVFSPRWLLPAIPVLWIGLAFSPPRTETLLPASAQFQYYMAAVPLLIGASLVTLARWTGPGGWLVGRRRWLALAVGIVWALAPFVVRVNTTGVVDRFRPHPEIDDFRALVATLPADTRVALNARLSYLVPAYDGAVLEFERPDSSSALFELTEHFFDWDNLAAFHPRFFAAQTQRTWQGRGGIAVVRDRGPGRDPDIRRLFTADPYAVAGLPATATTPPQIVAGSVRQGDDVQLALFAPVDGWLRLTTLVPIRALIDSLLAVPGASPLLVYGSSFHYSWRELDQPDRARSVKPMRPLAALGATEDHPPLLAAWGTFHRQLHLHRLGDDGAVPIAQPLTLPDTPTAAAWAGPERVLLGFADGALVAATPAGAERWEIAPVAKLDGRATALVRVPNVSGDWLAALRDPNGVVRLTETPEGKLEPTATWALLPDDSPCALAVGDPDGDGALETVVGHCVGNYVTIIDTDGEPPRRVVTGPFTNSLAVLDLDGDGRDEIVTPQTCQVKELADLLHYFGRHQVDTLVLDHVQFPPKYRAVLRANGWRVDRSRGIWGVWRKLP